MAAMRSSDVSVAARRSVAVKASCLCGAGCCAARRPGAPIPHCCGSSRLARRTHQGSGTDYFSRESKQRMRIASLPYTDVRCITRQSVVEPCQKTVIALKQHGANLFVTRSVRQPQIRAHECPQSHGVNPVIERFRIFNTQFSSPNAAARGALHRQCRSCGLRSYERSLSTLGLRYAKMESHSPCRVEKRSHMAAPAVQRAHCRRSRYDYFAARLFAAVLMTSATAWGCET